MKDKNKLIDIIERYVTEPYKKSLLKEVQPSIRLETTGNLCNELGKTKLGGCPDLPGNTSWQTSDHDNKPLSFLAQINLEDVKELDESNTLPSKGMLYFFFNIDTADDGKVLFFSEVKELEKGIPPEELKMKKKSFLKRLLTGKSRKRILKESEVEIYKDYYFPSYNSLKLEKIKKETGTKIEPIDAFKEGIFEDRYEEDEFDTTSNHHLLGNYNGIQNEFLESNFIDLENDKLDDLTLLGIEKALQWRLLFQFDSDNNLEFSWADWGRIYFFIHEDDLANQNFDNVKILADCY